MKARAALKAAGLVLAMLSFPVWLWAQQPAQQEQFCQHVGSMSTAITITEMAPSTDQDGDKWVLVRNRTTGHWMIGFIRPNGIFCARGQGRVNPES